MNSTQWADEAFARARVIGGTIHQRGFDGKWRSRPVDVQSQLRNMPRGALGVAARGAVVAGGVVSAYDLQQGIATGDADRVVDGTAGLTSLAVGALFPAAGITIGIGSFIGAEMREDEQNRRNGGLTFDQVVAAVPSDGC